MFEFGFEEVIWGGIWQVVSLCVSSARTVGAVAIECGAACVLCVSRAACVLCVSSTVCVLCVSRAACVLSVSSTVCTLCVSRTACVLE